MASGSAPVDSMTRAIQESYELADSEMSDNISDLVSRVGICQPDAPPRAHDSGDPRYLAVAFRNARSDSAFSRQQRWPLRSFGNSSVMVGMSRSIPAQLPKLPGVG